MRHRTHVVCVSLLVVAVAGCQGPERRAGSVETTSFIAGQSVEGQPITCEAFGSGDDVILIMAAIHGNEPAGVPLVHELRSRLVQDPELLAGKRVILMPVTNPDGLAKGTRRNARGVDLNRNFPTLNFSPRGSHGHEASSEPETEAILSVLAEYQPGTVVSIHQPLNCVDYDGPAQALAEAMSESGGLPVRKLGSRPGSMGSYVGTTLGREIITVELPGNASRLDRDALWEHYGPMLLEAIWFPEMVPAVTME